MQVSFCWRSEPMLDHSPANDDNDDEEENIHCLMEYRNANHEEPHACKRERERNSNVSPGVSALTRTPLCGVLMDKLNWQQPCLSTTRGTFAPWRYCIRFSDVVSLSPSWPQLTSVSPQLHGQAFLLHSEARHWENLNAFSSLGEKFGKT